MNVLDVGYAVAGVVSYPLWSRKARGGWGERFGKIEPVVGGRGMVEGSGGNEGGRGGGGVGGGRVVVHSVSVGEVNAVRSLVSLLARDGVEVVVTTTTDTGYARAKSVFAGIAEVRRYPLDFSWSVRRFLDAVGPDVVVLCELELWPNFLGACRKRGVPVCVVNGRLSERSFKNYRKAKGLLGGMFGSLEFAAVQDEAYAGRFVEMGVARDRVHVTGQMKWDTAPGGLSDEERAAADALAASMGIDRSRPLVVAGSTGPIEGEAAKLCGFTGEEALLHAAIGEVERLLGGGVQLLCAPRRPERFDEAFAALGGGEGRCVRRSVVNKPASGRLAGQGHVDRYLLDTIGELRLAYSLADVVVIGRSFGALHGSDPIEACSLGKPVLSGPRMGDFVQSLEVLEGAGAMRRVEADGLAGAISALLGDPSKRMAVGEAGAACVAAQRGASERNAALVAGLVREVCGT